MGGADSEVRDSTRAIILEAANFNGTRVRRMSTQLGYAAKLRRDTKRRWPWS